MEFNVEWDTVAIVAVALLFNFINGMQGSANIVAALISSRAMYPRSALMMAATAEVVGLLAFGGAVAATIGKDFLAVEKITALVLFCGLLGAILWSLLATRMGIPSSASHALLGGLIGAGLAYGGPDVLVSRGIMLTLLGLLASPFIGMFLGFILVRLLYVLTRDATPKVNKYFQRGQIIASILVALGFGSNDGQKVVGVIVLGLVLTETQSGFLIPSWAVGLTAVTLALGTAFGGQRLIRTVGTRFYRIRPIHGMGAQGASSSVIFLASMLGAPISTSQIVSSSIVGAGSADRISKVRWHVFDRIGMVWLLTIPAAGTTAAILLLLAEGVRDV